MMPPGVEQVQDRRAEWFVPRFGPEGFRLAVGLLFLPYTGMVLAFTVIGAMLAETVAWDRVVATVVVYFFGLGIAAHALDALGSKQVKPWGHHFTTTQLWTVAIGSLVIAYAIGIYYIIRYAPLLWVIAVLEGFFVFAYNLEWFGGRFHTDGWFAFSWGVLPVLAGYILQTNQLSVAAVVVAGSMGLLSLVEISASRPYKALKRALGSHEDHQEAAAMQQYEAILKSVSLGVITLGVGLAAFRLLP